MTTALHTPKGNAVQPLRRLAMSNRMLAGMVIALALAMKLFIPTGFMPTLDDGHIVVSVCSGMGQTKMVIAIPGLEKSQSKDGQHSKAEQPCAFAGLSAPSLAAVDPLLLAIAILFVLALGIRPLAKPASKAPPYLRPPLRGPPAFN